MRTHTKLVLPALLLGAGFALAAPLAASAHVHVTPGETPAGSATVIEFSSGHGCDGSPTTAYTVTIPEGFDSVAPVLNGAYDISETRGAANADGVEPIETVTYTPTAPITDGYYSTFSLRVTPGEDLVGETVAFPVLQTCVTGSTDWSGDPADESEGSTPAPAIVVSEATEDDGHGHAAAETEESDEHAEASSDVSTVDTAARVLGVSGLVVGAVGVVIAVLARRKPAGK
ncbi:DUF1775 domain-containing protein [Agromyces seonyuensis]|uniref:DUF1775 domain-containing protein n=1 Tax=Agromyces seonyuensis TaxID=2662446 RepID=A0A6I4NZX3_9MICO|nr:DUF1775 domain-containing protein [Agromyces seonyuensis]MWB99850.1 DUF1775 domain-containing protein [Agromyces seonyuensis]